MCWVILTVEEGNPKAPIYQVGWYQGHWHIFHSTPDKAEAIAMCSKLNGGN